MMMLPWVHHRVPKGQVDPPVYPLHTSIVLTKVRQKIGVERPVSLWDVLFGLAGTIECAVSFRECNSCEGLYVGGTGSFWSII